MARKRYLIIGDGAAGLAAAQTLRSASSSARITVVSDDPHPGYFRAALTNYLLGELREDQLWAVPPDFYQNARISRVHCRVVGLDTDKAVAEFKTFLPRVLETLRPPEIPPRYWRALAPVTTVSTALLGLGLAAYLLL